MSADDDIPFDLRSWVMLYANQEPRQAELHVPLWVADVLSALTEDERAAILAEVVEIAGQFGLQTPIVIKAVDDVR